MARPENRQRYYGYAKPAPDKPSPSPTPWGVPGGTLLARCKLAGRVAMANILVKRRRR